MATSLDHLKETERADLAALLGVPHRPRKSKTPPPSCEACGGTIGKTFYDAKLRGGPWGNICHGCFTAYGMGLGTGLGQKYKVEADGIYYLVRR